MQLNLYYANRKCNIPIHTSLNNPPTNLTHFISTHINEKCWLVVYVNMKNMPVGCVWSVPIVQGSWGQFWAHLGPVGPGWAPRCPNEPNYQGTSVIIAFSTPTNAFSLCPNFKPYPEIKKIVDMSSFELKITTNPIKWNFLIGRIKISTINAWYQFCRKWRETHYFVNSLIRIYFDISTNIRFIYIYLK